MGDIANDDWVEAIAIQWQGGPGLARTSVSMPEGPGARLLRGYLTITYWTGFLFTAEGVLERAGRDVNDSGFRYPGDELDEDTPKDDDAEDEIASPSASAEAAPGETLVEVYNPYETVTMREAAFVRLMSRLYQAVSQGAARDGDPVTQKDWWPRFVEVAEAIRARAAGG